MTFSSLNVLLGSRSPRRLELLRQLLPDEEITILPPRSSEESGFEGLGTWPEIETRIKRIAREKSADVARQCEEGSVSKPDEKLLILTADTVIVAGNESSPIVLGQPPEPDWKEAVRDWFRNYLSGKTHRAATAVCLTDFSGKQIERVAVSEVTFSPLDEPLLEWYLSTEEPRGKAGGYGIQGAGSLFVSELKGSLSNVIGLPLRDVWEMLAEFSRDF